MQGRSDTASFIQAFTGSHRFVLDYLVEEVLQRQPERAQLLAANRYSRQALCSSV
jgi:LuxR family transcriptional regulator, maltose regulon positive regulatory protein